MVSISPMGVISDSFDVLFTIVPILMVCLVVFVLAHVIRQKRENDNSPRLTVDAKVVAKRRDVDVRSHANAGDPTGAHGFSTSTSTTYYATFEVESGDRIEFSMSGSDYGMLAEGDEGKLSFQGTRYLGFERV